MRHLVLVANCFPVKGYKRSIICDTTRNAYEFIPNSLFTFLKEYNKSEIDSIRKNFTNSDWIIIETYLKFLEEKEFIFYTDRPELFPEIRMEWETPLLITNAIIDIDNESEHDLPRIFSQLNELRCEALEIRTFTPIDGNSLRDILSHTHDSSLRSVYLLLANHEDYTKEYLNLLLSENARLMLITIHSAELNYSKESTNTNERVLYIWDKITDESHCGAISKFSFSNNISLFMESHFYNNCLYKKISIDKKGFIKNCPSSLECFGHHHDTLLSSVLEKEEFKNKWNIRKDNIAVCKDCEFRYICIDCRVYVEDEMIPNSKPRKCNYNPYRAIWENEKTS